MTVSAPSGIFAPVKILIISPFLIFLLKFCPAIILPNNFKLVSLFLFKSECLKAYPSTAELLKEGTFIFEIISLDKILPNE